MHQSLPIRRFVPFALGHLLWCSVSALLIGLGAGGCGTNADPLVPGLNFKMYSAGSYDPGPFEDAWAAARANPSAGVAYTFPLVTTGIAAGSEVRLLAGRSSNPGSDPTTTGDDVIIADEHWLTTSEVGADGTAEFRPLSVASGAWASDTDAIPADLLCGTTVVAVRAYQRGKGSPPAYRFLAATFMVATTACTPSN